MVDVITESGMDFVADNVFHIEDSMLYTDLRNNGVKCVEFVRVKGEELLFIEAKASFSNPNNPSVENPKKFDEEIDDIFDKFIHSLHLFASVKVGVNEETLPCNFVIPEKVSLKFVLVVKNHKLDWCMPIQKGLMANLNKYPPYFKEIWDPNVLVLNHEKAVQYGFVK